MSILQKYLDKKDNTIGFAFSNGFHMAISLNLPILFAKWKDENLYQLADETYYPKVSSKLFDIMKLIRHERQDKLNLEILYDYWLNNILKMEDLL